MSTDSEMGFWEHLDVLRGVVLRIGVVMLALMVGFFILMPKIFSGVILAPCSSDFPLYRLFTAMTAGVEAPFSVNLVNIELASQLFIHLSASFNLALVVGFPIYIYILWGFVKPGLYEHERSHATVAFIAATMMFYLGVAVGYFIVFPVTLRFLATYQLSPLIPNVISISSYMDYFMTMTLIMGVVFEMPLLGWLLGRMGLVKRSFFVKYRRHAIVVLLVCAALITPTGDPFTLAVVFFPLYMLYELTALLVNKN